MLAWMERGDWYGGRRLDAASGWPLDGTLVMTLRGSPAKSSPRYVTNCVCSPSRAALLTGRNSHAVGFGSVGEFAGGYFRWECYSFRQQRPEYHRAAF